MSTSTEPKRILLVDDEPMVRRSIELLLNHLGYKVDLAADGQEALQKLGAGSYGLILADFYMPGMKGDALADEVRSSWPAIPVVLMTGSTGETVPGEFAALLRKPFSIDEMRSVLRTFMAGADTSASRS